MPTYEYRCPDGHDFEKFVQKISLASAELPCPVCGKVAARQISAGGGFVFKGSGFYITDYGKDGKKDLRANAAAASASDNKTSADKAADTKSDSATPAASPAGEGESKKSDAPKKGTPKNEKAAAAPSAPKSPGKDK
jgi:putative FmdB family regulatory protein